MNCGNLIKDSNRCRPPVPGVNQTLYLTEHNNILDKIKDIETNNLTDIFTNETGFYFRGVRTSLNPSQELTVGNNINFVHRVSFLIMDVSNLQKKQIRSLTRGRYVGVILNNDKSIDSAIEIYGLDFGLETQPGVLRALNSTETGSSYQIELLSEQETDLPMSFLYNNNYSDSLALLLYRLLAEPRFNFMQSNEGFEGDASGEVEWVYSEWWSATSSTDEDSSGVLSKVVDLPNTEKLLFGFEIALTGAGVHAAGAMTLEILNGVDVIHTYQTPAYTTVLNTYLYFYHNTFLAPFTLGFRVTFNDATNSPELILRACGIARQP